MSELELNPEKNRLRIAFVGGCGEFGMNCAVVFNQKRKIMLDCGGLFPDATKSGVEVIVPSPDDLKKTFGGISAYVITHGHEDHIGSLPYVFEHMPAPIYANSWTCDLIRSKFSRLKKEHLLKGHLLMIEEGKEVTFNELKFKWIHVNHSIPGASSVWMKFPEGSVLFSGDFKVDDGNIYEKNVDRKSLRDINTQSLDIAFLDSTNAFKDDYCPSELSVLEPLAKQIKDAPGAVVLSTFASNLWRLKTILAIADRLKKKVLLLGGGLSRTISRGLKYNLLDGLDRVLIEDTELKGIARNDLIILASGCQGERLAGLSRIVYEEYKHFKIAKGDRVILSSRMIPGNEMFVLRLKNKCEYLGIEFIDQTKATDIHVSGHAHSGDIKEFVELANPKFSVPVHGSFFHLRTHQEFLKNTTPCLESVVSNGTLLEWDGEKIHFLDKLEFDRLYVDGYSHQLIEHRTYRSRSKIAELGMVVFSGIYSTQTGRWLCEPQLTCYGLGWPEKTNYEKWSLRTFQKIADACSEYQTSDSSKEINEHCRIKLRMELYGVFHKKVVTSCQIHII